MPQRADCRQTRSKERAFDVRNGFCAFSHAAAHRDLGTFDDYIPAYGTARFEVVARGLGPHAPLLQPRRFSVIITPAGTVAVEPVILVIVMGATVELRCSSHNGLCMARALAPRRYAPKLRYSLLGLCSVCGGRARAIVSLMLPWVISPHQRLERMGPGRRFVELEQQA